MPTNMKQGKIMRKLLGQPTTTTSSETYDTRNSFESAQLRPNASQNTVYSADTPIACLDRSPDGHRAVIAGSKVFKVLRIDGSTITDDFDLRSTISSYATTHDISAATADQFNIRAVKWSHSELDTTIITACGNGRITLYDLNRSGEGLEVARIHEHARQVHKLAINPFKCNWLLSASQDGTVKSFDIRTPSKSRHGPTFRSLQTFKCNADAVRDVKWSPIDGFEFACSTDSGAILKWDLRKPTTPLLKITAHQSSCFSIAWHPDGKYLVSGGMDHYCKVWDVSDTAESRQKPKYAFVTPAPISNVSWRPSCWSATAQGKRAAQVTVAYDDSNASRNQSSNVHIWDLARPSFPFKEIQQWHSSPSGLLWASRDLLWSVDRDGRFWQTDVAFLPQLIERRSLSNFSFSPNGDVLMLLEKRQSQARQRPPLSPERSPSFQHGPNGVLLSVSQSDSEEDVVGSFLGPRPQKDHRRRHSTRSVQALSTTPPSVLGMAESKILTLDEAVNITGTYKPQQVMAIGHAPSSAKRVTYQMFSNRYLERMAKDSGVPIHERLASTIEYFAETAEDVQQYRLAQTWRILGYTMNLLLTRRAEYHRETRLAPPKLPEKKREKSESHSRGEETPRKFHLARTPADSPKQPAKRLIPDEYESTSNVATPLVRPVLDTVSKDATATSNLVEDDVLNLPEAAHLTSPNPIPVPRSNNSNNSPSILDGYDFYGIDSLSPTVDFIAPQRKPPLRLDYTDKNATIERMQPQRHDSAESFQMFSTSAESQSAKFVSSSESSMQENSHSLRERVSSWENSFASSRDRASADSETPGHSPSSEEQRDSFAGNQATRLDLLQNPKIPPVFRLQEPSFTSGFDVLAKRPIEEEQTSPTSGGRTSNDPNITDDDYLPWPNDPKFTIPPIDQAVLVQRCIDFEVQTGALNAAAMVLLFGPLLPAKSIDNFQAAAILRQYHSRLTSMKLFTEATLLRNLSVPLYPSVFSIAQENVTVGYFCTDCHKPLENDPLILGSLWYCPRCSKPMDSCVVCRQRDPEEELTYDKDTVDSAIWWLCPGCGHGGHTICMAAWHSGPTYSEGSKHSGGCCPLEGCLHPCLPGTWRSQRTEERNALKEKELEVLIKENTRQGSGRDSGRAVRRDTREVHQSKAVEGARAALGSTKRAKEVNQSRAVEGVSVRLGLANMVGLERKRSVKVVAPGEEQ
jgi:WD40 repeat protein